MKLICANFKMNFLKENILNYLENIHEKINKDRVIFFPSNLYISDFKKENYLVGSQDISFKEFGSLTGETSIKQLKELGISYTLIGHSERRKYFNDNRYINAKVKLALKNDLKVILCIGESLKERDNNLTSLVLKKEIDEALKNNNCFNLNNLIIAYEPIWSIGTSVIPDNKVIFKIVQEIKDYLKNKYDLNLKVLYGGSVNLENIDKLENISNLDGYLIGGASLQPEKFLDLIRIIK